MARILAISSQVARGSVGLSIIVPALQALGHEVIPLPTVLLSSHPGHVHGAGTHVRPEFLGDMLEALEANGWLGTIDGILTGYVPSVLHVGFAAEAVRRVRALNPAATHLCDPVMGDDPGGLYIEQAAAQAVRDTLVPLAGIITPNRFELSFLTGTEIRSARDLDRKRLNRHMTFATSIPSGRAGETLNVMYSAEENALTRVPVRPNAPHGTGDLFAALVLSDYLAYRDPRRALGYATAGVDATLAASVTLDRLSLSALMPHPPEWVNWKVEDVRIIG